MHCFIEASTALILKKRVFANFKFRPITIFFRGEGKVKQKTSIVVLTLAAIMIMAFSSFNNVSAQETFTEHMSAYGATMIDIPGHPQILIEAYHFDSGHFGSGDVLRIFYNQETTSGNVLQNVAVYTDMTDRIPFLQELSGQSPTSIQSVSASHLEVKKEGNSKTIMIVWKTPLEVPTEENWPAGQINGFTIPPGRLILTGHSHAVSGYATEISADWTQTLTWTSYYAKAAFVCPTWHFGGPVGENSGQNPTIIYKSATLVSIESLG
jgi:hypothetical protein